MMNNSSKIIADSSAIVSLLSKDDSNNQRAQNTETALKNASGRLIIPMEVYAETMNVLGRQGGHEFAIISMKDFMNSPIALLYNSNDTIRDAALEYFRHSPASVSYTDCIVMAHADHFDTKIIFGFDEVFKKNGYQLPG